MQETWTLARRELRSYFDSPAAYVVLSVFLLFSGWFFATPLFIENNATMRSVFDIIPFIFLFFVPAVTMSTFAEERRSGTLELLLTMPVRDWQVIAGKLLAVMIFLSIGVGLTFVYAVSISMMGDLDFGQTAGGYVGLLLLGMATGAIGIFASSLTRNQIVAFILGFAIIFVLYLMDKVTAFLPGWLAGILQYLGTDFHYRNLLRGVIDTRDVLYYLSVTALAGVLTAYSLARRPE
ncbi:MAG: ABC transporter permease [Rhodothermales bacterium]|nr:ABC transporter permease [Rhodothermales bacterium]